MKIGILYNHVDSVSRGFDYDKISDNDVLKTVEHIRGALAINNEILPVLVDDEILARLTPECFDLIFNLCEGIGSDITREAEVAAALDHNGIVYTGAGADALSLCVDKIRTKKILSEHGIKTPAFQLFKSSTQRKSSKLKFPLIVKPMHEDASVGINRDSVVRNTSELKRQVDFILENYMQDALVEEYIEGRELNVAILGNGRDLQVLPISEIVFTLPDDHPRILTYEAKWCQDSHVYKNTTGRCFPDLPNDVAEEVRAVSVLAYRLTGCRDYARVDLRLSGNTPYVLEVNPNPDLDVGAGFERSGKAAGMDYPKLIAGIILETLKRYPHFRKISRPLIDCASKRLSVRRVIQADTQDLIHWFNNPQVSKYMESPDKEWNPGNIYKYYFILNQKDLDVLYTDLQTGLKIGYGQIYGIDLRKRTAEISYLIGEPAFYGRGYGTEMVELLLQIAFEKLGLNSVEAGIIEGNLPSMKVCERLGFKRTKVNKGSEIIDGKKTDEIIFELSASEYLQKNKPAASCL
ncbi:MAG: GNAT family N-acetyltransferase [Candidatus Wallbacteria bacterium]|nr:GNAT family N-acetyltransferase [Candidatus Wallbacteria bacterium]